MKVTVDGREWVFDDGLDHPTAWKLLHQPQHMNQHDRELLRGVFDCYMRLATAGEGDAEVMVGELRRAWAAVENKLASDEAELAERNWLVVHEPLLSSRVYYGPYTHAEAWERVRQKGGEGGEGGEGGDDGRRSQWSLQRIAGV